MVRSQPCGGHDEPMKRSTAVGHLVEMAEVAQEQLRLRGADVGWPLEELWAAGPFLEGGASFEHGAVVLVLDVPADEVPWLAVTPTTGWIDGHLRLGKRPLRWCHRPAAWPAWNGDDPAVARFWSASHGVDERALESLRMGAPDPSMVVAPVGDELPRQLEVELALSRAHLRHVVEHYWDRD
jgi:hypothetical protein